MKLIFRGEKELSMQREFSTPKQIISRNIGIDPDSLLSSAGFYITVICQWLMGTARKLKPYGLLLIMIVSSVSWSKPAEAQESRHSGGATGPVDVKPLMVGQQLPDEFWKKEYLVYNNGDTTRQKLDVYKEKLIVLDFWATWCAICLASMKETEQLFNKYPNDVKLIFVNPTETKDDYKKIAGMQNQLSEMSLTGSFTSIIEDNYLNQLFPNSIYPRYVWIGPWGDLIALTTSLSVSEEHLNEILNRLKRNHDTK